MTKYKDTTIKSWLKLLDWENIPNFGPCHSGDNTFFSEIDYYKSEELEELENKLFTILQSDNYGHLRIVGTPGIGKTTFLYYLRDRLLQDHELSQKYCLYIFHANRAYDMENYQTLVRIEILNSLKFYYEQVGLEEIFTRVNLREISNKEKISILTTYMKDNREKFHKRLIFVLDDVDLLEDSMALNIARTIKVDYEIHYVIKWLSIRASTLERYNQELTKLINEFYPATYPVPLVPLKLIIDKRIKSKNGDNAKSPFSKEICEVVSSVAEENHRGSLPLLRSIMEDNKPKNLPDHTSEEFIQNYLFKSLMKTFVYQNKVPNLHLEDYQVLNYYPLLVDILYVLKYTKMKNDLVTFVKNIARNSRGPALVEYSEDIFQLRDNVIDAGLEILDEIGLVSTKHGKIINLTPLGKIITKHTSSDTYNEICLAHITSLGVELGPEYMKALKVRVNYENLAKSLDIWQRK